MNLLRQKNCDILLMFSQILSWLESEGIPFLEAHTEIGDSIGHVTSLQADFAHFEKMVEV